MLLPYPGGTDMICLFVIDSDIASVSYQSYGAQFHVCISSFLICWMFGNLSRFSTADCFLYSASANSI